MSSPQHRRQPPRPVDASRPETWGVAASSVLHAAAILAMSWLLLPGPAPRRIPAIETEWSLPQAELPEQPQPLQMPATPETAGGQTAPFRLANSLPVAAPAPVFETRVLPLPGPLVDAADLREAVPALDAGATGRGTGQGTGSGDGGGSGSGGTAFFPIDRPSGRFVFVVDCSKSMNHRYPGPAKTRLARVKIELWRSIYRMTPEQQFFIVFFNSQAIPMPAIGLVEGGPDRKQRLLDWTTGIRASGQTDPYDALMLAVRMQPDEIFFLTDGEFNYRVVREVTRANFAGIRIHTISLGDDSGGKFLEEIATKNHGTYRHIIAEEDRYWDEPAQTAAAPSALSPSD